MKLTAFDCRSFWWGGQGTFDGQEIRFYTDLIPFFLKQQGIYGDYVDNDLVWDCEVIREFVLTTENPNEKMVQLRYFLFNYQEGVKAIEHRMRKLNLQIRRMQNEVRVHN